MFWNVIKVCKKYVTELVGANSCIVRYMSLFFGYRVYAHLNTFLNVYAQVCLQPFVDSMALAHFFYIIRVICT